MNIIKLIWAAGLAVVSVMLLGLSPSFASPLVKQNPTPQVRYEPIALSQFALDCVSPAIGDRAPSTGCTCAQCVQAATLLQGRLPGL